MKKQELWKLVGKSSILNNQINFHLQERKEVFYHFMKYTYKNLEEGMVNITPKPGDILAAKPHGPKT
jgi:hypothetical protein